MLRFCSSTRTLNDYPEIKDRGKKEFVGWISQYILNMWRTLSIVSQAG